MLKETLIQPRAELAADCLSDLAFDEWDANEVSPEQATTFSAHVDSCERCFARRAELNLEKEEFLARFPDPSALREGGDADGAAVAGPVAQVTSLGEYRSEAGRNDAAAGSRSRRSTAVFGAAGAGLAIAAAMLLWFRAVEAPSDGEGIATRVKGDAHIGFFVKQGETVFAGSNETIVHPGDQLRFSVTTSGPTHFAILSRDGAGVASVYYPAGTMSESVGALRSAPLAESIQLDATLGREQLIGVFCDQPFELEQLREELERGGTLSPPNGCTLDEMLIMKESGP